MKLIRIIAVAAVLTAASCAKDGQPDQKAQARQQWNAARAGVMYGLAQDQFKNGNFPAARQTVGDALKLDPDNAQLHVLSARIEIEQGNIESAQRSLVRAGELKPELAETDYLMGVIHQRWQRPNEALAAYRAAVTKSPGELAYLLAESEMLVQIGRTEEAIHLLITKVTYFENSAAIRDAVGQLLTRQKRHAEAVPFFRQACILASDDPAMREHLALALYRSELHREAQEHLARLTRENPDARADLWLALGECQMSLGRAVEARASFESASRIDPMLAPAWLGIAKAAMTLNDHRRAELSIRKAISTGDLAFESQLMLGYLRLQQSRAGEALDAFRKASLLRPDDTTAICMVGFAHEQLGQREQAMEHYARALRLSPRDPLASRLLSAVGTND